MLRKKYGFLCCSVRAANNAYALAAEQSAVAQDIATNVERVARMSENNSGAMSEVSNTVDNLRKYSHELALSVAHFHI